MSPTNTISPANSSQNSSLGESSPSQISNAAYGLGQVQGIGSMDHHGYGSSASFPWHSPVQLSDFHNGCVQRNTSMAYAGAYKNNPCYSQGYGSSGYYPNMSDYFATTHHHPHHSQFVHHQMGNPYSSIPPSHPGQQNFVTRQGESIDSYGAKTDYQIKSEYQSL